MPGIVSSLLTTLDVVMQRQVPSYQTVMDQGTEKWLLTFRWMLWLAPAGLRGGLKLEAYHQRRQPQTLFLCGPRCSGSSVLCIRGHASAGHLVVYFVTAQMVGDRRFRGATILGRRFSTSSANHPVSVLPTGSEPRDGFSFRVVLGLRIVVQDVAASFSDALSRQPSSSSTSLRRLWLGVAAQASGTSLSDVSAIPDVAASRITRRRATAKSTPLTRRGAAAISTPLTRRGASAIPTPLTRRRAAARSMPLCPSDVASMSWPDRGHHVPALTVQAVGGVSV